MTLTNQEKLELFMLISNRVSNRRYKIDNAVLTSIAARLAEEIILGEIKVPKPDRGS